MYYFRMNIIIAEKERMKMTMFRPPPMEEESDSMSREEESDSMSRNGNTVSMPSCIPSERVRRAYI